MGTTRCGGGAPVGAEHRRFSGKVSGAARSAADSGPIPGVPTSSPRGAALHPRGASPGLLFPVAPQPETAPHPPFQAQRPPAPNTARPGRPSPLPLPPHLKPPAPRWAPPCGSCPWRRRHGRPPGAAETGTDSPGARTPLPPHRGPRPANRATPRGRRLPASAPPRPRRRRKWSGGGRGRLGEGGREALSLGGRRALLHAGRGGGAQPSSARKASLCSHGAPR